MNPPQFLHHGPHLLHICLHPHLLANTLLQTRRTIQEFLNQLPVHEPERLFRLPDRVLERAIGVEGDVAGAVDPGGDGLLEAHEQVLFRRGDEGEEVDGAIDLRGQRHQSTMFSAKNYLSCNGDIMRNTWEKRIH